MKKQISRKAISVVLSSICILSSLSGCGLGDNSQESAGTDNTASSSNAEVSTDEILTDTIEINTSDEYEFNAEEVMYLSGVKASAYKEGVKYTLRDLNEDTISELIISAGDKTGVYTYDAASNQAKRTTDYDGDIDNILKDDSVIWVDGGSQWVDGTIYGVANQMEDPGVKTDFYTSSNYDWLTTANVSTQGDSVSPADSVYSVEDRLIEVFEDRDKYQGDDIQRIRDYYDIATNWEKRESEGIEPVKKYLSAIDSINSIEDMNNYLSNPEVDPFCIFVTFHTTLDVKDTANWIVQIEGDDFSVLPRIYHNSDKEEIDSTRKDYDVSAKYVLEQAGYAPEDIDRIMEEFYDLENTLLDKDWPDDNEKEDDELLSQTPLDEISAKCENFPLGSIFEAYNITEGTAIVKYPEYLRTLDSIYTEENLSKLKSYCLAHTAYTASAYLNMDTVNAYYNYSDPDASPLDAEEQPEEGSGYTKESLEDQYLNELISTRGALGVAAENVYTTYMIDDEVRNDITELAVEIKDSFREIIESEDWMSDEGKKACIAKLDNMEFSILKSDNPIDSSYLAVNPDSSYLDAFAQVTVNTKKHNGELVGQKRVKGDWRYDVDPTISTTINNCFYFGAYNQFFIMDGFLNDGTYRLDMSKEEKLATLGEVIGHELTHGFDPNGIQYDKDGNMVVTEDNPYGWMPEADYNAFMEKANKLADYFSTFVPYPYNKCDGSLYWGEAAADIGGMSIGLNIASKEENFDYDLYFRIHSKLWVKQSTLIVEQGDIFNEHPLYHLRINATCQQFDEFYDTYDITEGDYMYLAPDERVNIW